MTPFRKTGQLYQAISRGQPGKLVEKALTLLKNYQPSLEEELAHTSLLASAYALTSMYSLELSDAFQSLSLYDKLLEQSYPLKKEDWTRLTQVYRFVYDKTQTMENLEKAVFSANLSEDPHLISQTLLELYLKVREEDTFNLCLEKVSRFLQAKPDDQELLFIRAELYKEYGLRNKETKFLQLGFDEFEKIVALHPYHQKAKALSVVTNAFLSLFNEDAQRLLETVYKSQLLSEHQPIELYAKGISSLCYALFSSDLDELQKAIHFFQRSTSVDRTFDLGWHYLGISFFLMYEAIEDDRYLILSIRFFQKALQHKVRSETYIQLAIATSRLFDVDDGVEHLEQAKVYFEIAFSIEKGSPFPPTEWIFEYALLLDQMGEIKEDEGLLAQSIDQLNRVLILDPATDDIHYRIALTLSHLADLTNDANHFMRAFCHFRLAHKNNPDHDFVLLDWALTLINYGEGLDESERKFGVMKEAEEKLMRSAKQGNSQAYYQIACFYSLGNHKDLALEWMKRARSINALPPMQELLEDAWLENLRKTDEFHHFITLLNDQASDF
ncbi:MAG: TPR end-of-group domain-containing protein [Chlamydiia bacterium]